MDVTIFDDEFAHEEDNSFIGLRKPDPSIKAIKWNRDTDSPTKTCVFTDSHIVMGTAKEVRCYVKIALVLEPRSIRSDVVEYLLNDDSDYNLILTHDSELLDKSLKAYPCPAVLHFAEDWSEPKKSKLVSMIASGKNWAPGHVLRQEAMQRLRDKVDLFGREVNPIEKKDTGLRDYMFSVAIENSKDEFYFTEKLLDCFTTKTVPIYWGADCVNSMSLSGFNASGVITFDTLEELEHIINNLSEDAYNKMKRAIDWNHHMATQHYNSAESYILQFFEGYFNPNMEYEGVG